MAVALHDDLTEAADAVEADNTGHEHAPPVRLLDEPDDTTAEITDLEGAYRAVATPLFGTSLEPRELPDVRGAWERMQALAIS